MPKKRRDDAPSLIRSTLGALVVFALGWCLSRAEPIESFELRVLDLAFAHAGPPRSLDEPPSTSGDAARTGVAFILVDSGSLLAMRAFLRDEQGHPQPTAYPWLRLYYGAVVDFLHQAGAKAVVLDYDFSGPSPYDLDTYRFLKVLEQAPIAYLGINLKTLPPLEKGSAISIMAESDREVCREASIAVEERVRLAFEEGVFNAAQVPYVENLPEEWVEDDDGDGTREKNLELSDVARGLGALNGGRDPGEPVRDLSPLFRFEDGLLPSFSLAAAVDILGTKRLEVDADRRLVLHGEKPEDTRSIPLDDEGRLLLHWYGPLDVFDHYPFHRTLKIALADYERRVPEESDVDALYPNYLRWKDHYSVEEVEAHKALFRDKIVFLGVNASELGDVYANPFAPNFPGVAIHATALLNLLRGDLIRRAPGPWRDGVLLLVALIAGVGTAAVGGERRGLLLFSGLLVAYPLAALGAFHAGLVWFDTIVPLSVAALSYGTAAYLHYRRTGRLKRQLRATFDHVLQPALIDHLLSDPRRLILGGESRRLSILFTDLQNSTALSESLPAEEWVARLNRYFSRGTGVVLSHNAYLDKFIGDGLMAVWGAPVPLESHEEEACRAVVELRQALGEVEEAIHREHGVRLVTRMGLNSGEVIAGMVGSEGLSHYTVLGDPVVVASRLEGANKFFGTRTLIGESTWARSRGVVEGREIDLVVLKGKSKAIKIYEPLAFRGELDERGRLLVERYGRALELYRARRFKEAIVELEALLERVPDDGPSKVLVERARALLDAEPPEEWAGEHVLASK